MAIKNFITDNKKATAVIVSVIVFVMGFITWRIIKGPSPEEVRQSAIRAFEKGDAEALCALADPEELKRTGLSPEKVTLLLNSTLWKNGFPKQVSIDPRLETPIDQGFWNVHWANKQGKHKVIILANDHPDNGWHLNLSWTLFSICVWKNDRGGTAAYYKFAHENSITDFRDQAGIYDNPRYFGDLSQIASN